MTTANDYLASDLCRQARDAAARRGHMLRAWVQVDGRLVKMTDCRECGAEAWVNAAPRANETHVSGAAVATECPR